MRQPGVCIVVENLPVPLDRRVWREACVLRDAGYRVSVICPKGEGRFNASHEVLEGIEIYRHRSWEASKISGYLLEYSLAFISEFLLTVKVFARTRFRVLQACNPPDTIFLIALFFKIFGVRFIFDQHDLCPELYDAKFGQRVQLFRRFVYVMERCSYRVANICISTNESFKEIAVARGGKRAQDVFVVRNCPTLTFSRSQRRTGEKFGKSFLVTYVGFMGSQDGLNLLVQSISYIVHQLKRQDTHFVFVGSGTVIEDLGNMIQTECLSSYITLTGQVSHEDVATYLLNSDVGVAPDPKNALNDHSTMIKLFEYMAFGLPIVLFDLKEGRRIAGSAALYAEPNDVIDFANQIVRLLDSKYLRDQLGSFGRKRIEEELNWETEKASLLRAYEAALGRNETSLHHQQAAT